MLAEITQSLPVDKVEVNWFDVAAVLILVVGLFRGRKNGMSMEVLPLFQWLSVVIVSAWFYPAVARWLVNATLLKYPAACVMGYALLALAIFFVFSQLKRALTAKLFGSNLFGNAEYYLGMPSGLVRFGCMLLFALAFLNARHYTPQEIKAHHDYEQRWYGSDFFPGLQTVQEQVFVKSFTGHSIKKYLGVLLIQSVPPEEGQPEQKSAPVH